MKRIKRICSTILLTAGALTACDNRTSIRSAEASPSDSAAAIQRAELARARKDSIVRARPGYIVDSILPAAEEIRRFQATLDGRPSSFSHGAATRSALVARFVRAIEQNDTTALAHLVVDRNEFGYLVYPTSPNAAPPYRQAPDVVWLMRSAGTEKATSRLLGRFGGRPLGFRGYSCPLPPVSEGDNTLWSRCVVRRQPDGGAAIDLRMFGAIIERGGRYKFLSLTNGL